MFRVILQTSQWKHPLCQFWWKNTNSHIKSGSYQLRSKILLNQNQTGSKVRSSLSESQSFSWKLKVLLINISQVFWRSDMICSHLFSLLDEKYLIYLNVTENWISGSLIMFSLCLSRNRNIWILPVLFSTFLFSHNFLEQTRSWNVSKCRCSNILELRWLEAAAPSHQTATKPSPWQPLINLHLQEANSC